MADTLLSQPHPPEEFLIGTHTIKYYKPECDNASSRQHAEPTQSPFLWSWLASFSPDARAFDESMRVLLRDWDWLRKSLSGATDEKLEVSYDNVIYASNAAQLAPDMVLSEGDIEAYAGLSDFTYVLDTDY